MRQTFRIQHARDNSILNRKDVAKMFRRMADLLDKYADVYQNDPDHCAGETDAFPSRFEIFGEFRKNDIYPAHITVKDFQPKRK